MPHPPGIRRWGAHRVTVVLLTVLPPAAAVMSLIDPIFLPAIVLTLFPLIAALRVELRLTDDELIFRHLIGTTRIPRSDIAFARFDYKPLGVYLDIHHHSGHVDHLQFGPKMTSSELSGDPPPPDSAAYQITQWAQTVRPPTAD